MIKGKKVVLRALEKDDLDRCLKWINDMDVVKLAGPPRFPKSKAEEEKWFEKTINDDKNRVLAIDANGKHIGNVGLHNIDFRNRNAMLGIMIGEKKYWNKGYGSDAVKTLVSLAFNELNLHKIYLHVFPSNKRALKCYEKCGFKKEGVLREHVFKGGKYQDLTVMSIINKGVKK
ncbi:MAG: GNAT family protein [Thermoplasmatales archaeon]|nr:GNAT family protein [Thermoplasmatales archaeon]